MANQGGSHQDHVRAGQQSHKNEGNKDRQQQAADDKNNMNQHGGGGKRGGSGNFANDRERASEAGRKGGQS